MEYIVGILLIVGITITAIRSKEYTYFHRFFLFIDTLIASIFTGRGDITISARCGLACKAGKPWGCLACWILDKIQPNHCELAIEADKRRARNALKELGE